MKVKYTAKCGEKIAGMVFQTCSSLNSNEISTFQSMPDKSCRKNFQTCFGMKNQEIEEFRWENGLLQLRI